MGRKASIPDKPDLPRHLFWDFRYDGVEWRKEYLTVIARVIERGNLQEWAEMIRFIVNQKLFMFFETK